MGSLEARYRNKLAPSKSAPKKKQTHTVGELVFPTVEVESTTVQSSTGKKIARRRGRTKPEPKSIAPGGCDRSPKPSPPTPTIPVENKPSVEVIRMKLLIHFDMTLEVLHSIVLEMQGINVNIHPLKHVVLQRWRDTLAKELMQLTEVRSQWPSP